MWLMASRRVSCTTCVDTSMVMLIREWPRFSVTTRGATPVAVAGVVQPDDAGAGGNPGLRRRPGSGGRGLGTPHRQDASATSQSPGAPDTYT